VSEEDEQMAAGRIRRSARRGLTVAVLGWVGVAAASVLTAPPAAAASSYVVHIKDLTPPVASVDKNGTVRFIDEIPDKTVSVSVGPGGILGGVTLVNVTAKTQVTLTLPSGDHPLEPTTDPAHPTSLTAWDEVFHSTCVTCKITYRYELSSGNSLTAAISDAAIKELPPLPVPTPFVVNTLIPLPNVPSVGLPKLPQIVVPGTITGLLPQLPNVSLPKVPALPKGGTVFPKGSGGPVTIAGIPGNIYSYLSADGTPQLVPAGSVAAPGFDSSRYFGTSGGSAGSVGGNAASGGSSGSGAGSDNGVSVPVYPQQGAKTVSGLATDSAQQPLGSGSRTFPAIALAAVLVLGAATAALVRTYRAARASR
jgi:hypothetical protein